jgi:hypothetical protein
MYFMGVSISMGRQVIKIILNNFISGVNFFHFTKKTIYIYITLPLCVFTVPILAKYIFIQEEIFITSFIMQIKKMVTIFFVGPLVFVGSRHNVYCSYWIIQPYTHPLQTYSATLKKMILSYLLSWEPEKNYFLKGMLLAILHSQCQPKYPFFKICEFKYKCRKLRHLKF